MNRYQVTIFPIISGRAIFIQYKVVKGPFSRARLRIYYHFAYPKHKIRIDALGR